MVYTQISDMTYRLLLPCFLHFLGSMQMLVQPIQQWSRTDIVLVFKEIIES